MEASLAWFDANLIVLTLAHFLWQGALVWAVVAAWAWIVQPRRAQSRYAMYCATLVVLAVCPVATLSLSLLSNEHETFSTIGSSSPRATTATYSVGAQVSPYAPSAIVDGNRSWNWQQVSESVARFVHSHQRAVLAIWVVGIAGYLLRLLVGSLRMWRVARHGGPLPTHLQQAVGRLSRQMGFRVLPVVRVVDELSQAVAVGIVRPMVLLPAAWVTGLDGQLLEAVLAHELAHLRRWDLAINLLQRVVEAMLFFHPAVWWCSRRIRAEREMCCDEAAVAALGNPVPYAKALAQVAHHVGSAYEPAWSVGIGGSKMALLERIRNVLGLGASNGNGRWYGPSCAAVGAAAASLAWGFVLVGMTSTDSQETVVGAKHVMPEGGHEVGVPIGPAEDKLFQRAFADHVARHPLGVRGAIQHDQAKMPPELAESQTHRRTFGEGVPAPAPPEVVAKAPTEYRKTQLPAYTIEPPDILFIEALRVVPNAPYHVQPGDELQVIVEPPEANLAARGFFVDPQGRIDLGPRYGKIKVRGLTTDEAEEAVRKFLEPLVSDCAVSVTLVQGAAMQPITGEHLVAPDGTVNLGMYGLVQLAGKTLPEARRCLDEHLGEYLDDPKVAVSVFAYNSRVCYVITQGTQHGDVVHRLPVTGNETVLDAFSQVKGLDRLSDKHIWIARPAPNGAGCDAILPVSWQEIAHGGKTLTNYQLLPGDRVFIADEPPTTGQQGEQQDISYNIGDKY
jgi:beta-lactamase regulating signal transducer with metallopeptidase domain/protein involved in polysaccharide export with SLBB domain